MIFKNKMIRRVTLSILVIGGFLFLGKSLSNKNIQKKVDNAEKFIAIEEFKDSKELVTEQSNPVDVDNLSQGTSAFLLNNRIEFIEKFPEEELDKAVSIINGVADTFMYLPLISSEINNFDTKEYFNANKNTIFELYGISKYSQFEDLVKKITSIGTLKDYTFDVDSVIDRNTQCDLDIVVHGEKKDVIILVTSSNINERLLISTICIN